MREKGQTYAGALGARLADVKPIGVSSAQFLAQLTNYSYEHCRRVLGGQPVVSRKFNEIAAALLGLDEEGLWSLAIKGKQDRLAHADVATLPAVILERWAMLTPFDRKLVERIVKALSERGQSHS